MRYFTKSGIYIFLIILLALLNVSLILFFWKGPPSKYSHRDRGRGQARMELFVARKLDFSREQVKEYKRLRKEHFQEVEPAFKEMRRLKRALFDLLGRKHIFVEKQQLLEQIGKTQSAIDSLTFTHFEKLRNICNESQKSRFDEIINEVTYRLTPSGSHHRGRRGRLNVH